MDAKVKRLKDLHDIACKNKDITLYFYDKLRNQWLSIDDENEITDDGFLIFNYDDEMDVTYGQEIDGHGEGEKVKEYCRVTYYLDVSSITDFKLCRIQPKDIKSQLKSLNNLLC